MRQILTFSLTQSSQIGTLMGLSPNAPPSTADKLLTFFLFSFTLPYADRYSHGSQSQRTPRTADKLLIFFLLSLNLLQIGTLMGLSPNAPPAQRAEWDSAQGRVGQECTHGSACHQPMPGIVTELQGACVLICMFLLCVWMCLCAHMHVQHYFAHFYASHTCRQAHCGHQCRTLQHPSAR